MFKKEFLLFIFIGLLVYSQPVYSQILEPVRWEFEKEWISGDELLLIAKASIEANWYLYGLEIPEGGPIPTSFHLDDSEHFDLIGDVREVVDPVLKYDPFFDMELPLFSVEAWFSQKVRILTGEEFKITGFVEFMSCDDERCLPPQEKAFQYLIKPGPQSSGSAWEPEKENTPVNEYAANSKDVTDISVSPDIAVPSLEDTGAGRSLWLFFFIAFAGGLAGLLTPCVFPMIPMTVSFFIQKQSGRINSIINAFVFGISIIAVYTGLGLLVSLTSVGAGFANQLTSH